MRWNLRPVARAIDWPSEVLPTPGGPTKHRIGLLPVGVELAHREVLEDAALDLVQAEVVLIEDLAGFGDVDVLAASILPRQFRKPLEVGAQHRALGAALAHALQALELLDRVLVDVLGHAGGLDRLLQLLELGGGVVALAELLLDLAHLLAQHVLALALVELLLGLVADLLGDAQHADALAQELEHLVEAPLQVEGLEQVLLVLVLHVEQVGHHVGEQRRRGHALHHDRELLGRVGQQLDRLDRLLP